MSKHGGSPLLGLTPAGIEQHSPAVEGGRIIAPEIARTNAQAKERALQFERRRLALALLDQAEAVVHASAPEPPADLGALMNDAALRMADDLLAKTGGHV